MSSQDVAVIVGRTGEEKDDRLFAAKCISDLAFRLGKPPGQLTVTEIKNERDRILAIYDAL